MKIVIDAREYPTSTGRYIRKLIENLEKLKSEHKFVILLLPKDFDAYQPNNKNFTKLAAPFPEFSFSEQIGFLRFIRNLKPDLVHFCMIQQPILYSGLSITTAHDLTTVRFRNPATPLLLFKIKQLAYSAVILRMARHSKKVITPSLYVKNDLASFAHVNAEKIIYTHESADQITVAPEAYEKLENKKFLMFVGRVLPHKNITRLLDAFKILQKNNPALHMVFVGKKDILLENHLTYAKKHGIKNVLATGYVTEGQLRWLYENCAVYTFPSLSEGFGLPSLEAMVHGAPVASSDATCLPEVNGDAAHYFNPLDVEDMARKINDILIDEKLRKDLIKKGSEQVKKYSWERMAKQTLEVYDKVLKSRL